MDASKKGMIKRLNKGFEEVDKVIARLKKDMRSKDENTSSAAMYVSLQLLKIVNSLVTKPHDNGATIIN